MASRRFAYAAPIADRLQRVHFRGLPVKLTGGTDLRQWMPRAMILLLEEDSAGSAMLWRYADNAEDAGDSWHESVDAS